MDDYITFEVNIENVDEKYFLLFVKTITNDEINYQKSSIITGYNVTRNIQRYTVNNRIEHLELLKEKPLAKFEKISIPKKYANLDIIYVQASSKPFYSEKLIDFLFDCGITGLSVKYTNPVELDFY